MSLNSLNYQVIKKMQYQGYCRKKIIDVCGNWDNSFVNRNRKKKINCSVLLHCSLKQLCLQQLFQASLSLTFIAMGKDSNFIKFPLQKDLLKMATLLFLSNNPSYMKKTQSVKNWHSSNSRSQLWVNHQVNLKLDTKSDDMKRKTRR